MAFPCVASAAPTASVVLMKFRRDSIRSSPGWIAAILSMAMQRGEFAPFRSASQCGCGAAQLRDQQNLAEVLVGAHVLVAGLGLGERIGLVDRHLEAAGLDVHPKVRPLNGAM